MKIRYGTRKSKLALCQARYAVDIAKKSSPGAEFEEVIITTLGDKNTEAPLFKIGAQGLFIKEIERELLANRIDIAIHSLKDMPSISNSELCILAFGGAEDCRDCFVSIKYNSLFEMPPNATIGTSSLRRRCMLSRLKKDVNFVNMRGNLDTRLKKLQNNEADAIILASAGLKRLGLQNNIKQTFAINQIVPAPGQGILAIQCRKADYKRLLPIFKTFNDKNAQIRAEAEAEFLKTIQGGCSVPIGAVAAINGDTAELMAFVGSPNGSDCLFKKYSGPVNKAKELGRKAGQDMLANGADKLLKKD